MIEGKLFKPGSAAFSNAALIVKDDNYRLKNESQDIKFGRLDEISISDRLGNVQRKLTFEDGSVFSTNDNDAIDRLFSNKNKTNSFIHKLESNLSFVFISLLVTIVLTFSFFKWGVPAISTGIAEALPQQTNEVIGAHTFKFLDKYIFEETSLDEERQAAIRTHFIQKLIPSYKGDDEVKFTLHFRDWNDGINDIPNALALPSGDIILTDKFVELSQSQDEIDSVLLHEIGHIAHRHSLKMVVQSTIVTTTIMMVTGDANGVADMGIGLGSLLLSANYSRHFETEADQFAFDKMLELGIDPISFASIMTRITDYSEELFSSKNKSDVKPDKESNTSEETIDFRDNKITDYFSTHPATEKRNENAKRYSECFKQGLKVCD